VTPKILFLAALALSAAPQTHTFEVSSVKPSKPGATVQDYRLSFAGSQFVATSATVADVLRAISPLMQTKGGPDWVYSDRFDIVAKSDPAGGDPDSDDRKKMMLALLEDRFKMVSHPDQKEVDGLALVTGKNPPKLNPPQDGARTNFHADEQGRIVFQKCGMNGLAVALAMYLKIPVADQTGMAGQFDFTLEPNKFLADPSLPAYTDRVRAAAEDLGFRFRPQKATSWTLTIDHIERPNEN
jgi:uncharacterized protein (TIGR03435 family)